METVEQLRQSVRLMEANYETMKLLGSLLTWLDRYCKQTGIEPPNQARIAEQMDKISRILTDESNRRGLTRAWGWPLIGKEPENQCDAGRDWDALALPGL